MAHGWEMQHDERVVVIGQDVGVNGGLMGPNQFVALAATNPAKLFGLFPRKGTIAVGSDADLVVWDPEVTRTISAATHHMKADNNIFEGMTIRGRPRYVFLRGRKLADGDRFVGDPHGGIHQKSSPFRPVQL